MRRVPRVVRAPRGAQGARLVTRARPVYPARTMIPTLRRQLHHFASELEAACTDLEAGHAPAHGVEEIAQAALSSIAVAGVPTSAEARQLSRPPGEQLEPAYAGAVLQLIKRTLDATA